MSNGLCEQKTMPGSFNRRWKQQETWRRMTDPLGDLRRQLDPIGDVYKQLGIGSPTRGEFNLKGVDF